MTTISKVIVFKPSGKYSDSHDMILKGINNLSSDENILSELRVRKVSLNPGGFVVFPDGFEDYQVPFFVRIPVEMKL